MLHRVYVYLCQMDEKDLVQKDENKENIQRSIMAYIY